MIIREVPYLSSDLAVRALSGRPGLAWLDSASGGSRFGQYSYLGVAPLRRTAIERGASRDAALEVLRSATRLDTPQRSDDAPPFQGGVVVCFDYGLAEILLDWSPRLAADGATPVGHLTLYDTLLAWDHTAERCWALSHGLDDALRANPGLAKRRVADLAAALARSVTPHPDPSPTLLDWRPDMDRAQFVGMVRRVQAHIAQGDIYQANIAQSFSAALPAGLRPLDLYLSLRQRNPAPFSAFLDLGDRHVLSTSPERFLTVSGRNVEARPIKGTVRSSEDAATDARLKAALLASEKDRAENIMIVDLLRNDLSKVCAPGTVHTPEICALETYEGLHHLTSSIVGELRDGMDAADVIAAAFPGGSITGAPKLRAMEIIDDLEPRQRGVFCGSVGYIGFDGHMDLNIAIRTLEVNAGMARLHAGGGVTHLSDPDAEYEETLLKASRLIGAQVTEPAA